MAARQRPARRPDRSRDELYLSLVVAACLLLEAVIAKHMLDAELDFISQFAALWVYLVYVGLKGRRDDRRAAVTAGGAAVLATLAVLGWYAL